MLIVKTGECFKASFLKPRPKGNLQQEPERGQCADFFPKTEMGEGVTKVIRQANLLQISVSAFHWKERENTKELTL
ncbi:hypothetical protein ACD591_03815 [Rufibacter glacialis]|uniref:Uncharacterized protein n=1 Tax=Rufibacter glacialis TaxID=1259555 RepID=A0A5M8QHS9_9BACT|nr:hypothetical protein [Rufibacter glacialis]KAA6434490.1 hypothetical protein FOE74_09885 [Rufibacter glacialis]GGK70097.1 hypothetical protein GCM10011405_17670 [Rufibacter glacialis]